jgi:NAD(P)-dependent dehydrogenase (short-subunit alcohol dehydrogenase family)
VPEKIGKYCSGLGQRRRKCDLSRQNAGGMNNVAAKARSLRVKALAVTADVADINSVNAAVETACEFGTIDILINNAGCRFRKIPRTRA